ncbi:hypothetical protein PoB_004671200 [Plakobranchus ocellatus]|uniref:Uncharacterized protein n=1 Tax=Plakobranchus ocellatus TaxID=259542 RepID=A0AAV4BMQ3_9GAST|nr:hypothetical protein PoB_004671200 [Plakobranchus ocellatus]
MLKTGGGGGPAEPMDKMLEKIFDLIPNQLAAIESELPLTVGLTEDKMSKKNASAAILPVGALRQRQAFKDSMNSRIEGTEPTLNNIPRRDPILPAFNYPQKNRVGASHSQAAKVIIAVCMGAARLVHWSIV